MPGPRLTIVRRSRPASAWAPGRQSRSDCSTPQGAKQPRCRRDSRRRRGAAACVDASARCVIAHAVLFGKRSSPDRRRMLAARTNSSPSRGLGVRGRLSIRRHCVPVGRSNRGASAAWGRAGSLSSMAVRSSRARMGPRRFGAWLVSAVLLAGCGGAGGNLTSSDHRPQPTSGLAIKKVAPSRPRVKLTVEVNGDLLIHSPVWERALQ
jgi:hypothetical protein